jgi:hypothetical protein
MQANQRFDSARNHETLNYRRIRELISINLACTTICRRAALPPEEGSGAAGAIFKYAGGIPAETLPACSRKRGSGRVAPAFCERWPAATALYRAPARCILRIALTVRSTSRALRGGAGRMQIARIAPGSPSTVRLSRALENAVYSMPR